MNLSLSHINKIITTIDNHPEITTFKLSDGFILWIKIRYEIFRILLDKNIYTQKNIQINKSTFIKILSRKFTNLNYYFQLLLNNPHTKNKYYEGIIISTSNTCVKKEDGRYISKINNFFNNLKPGKNLNLFYSFNGKYKKTYISDFAYADFFSIFATVRSKIRNKSKSIDKENVRLLILFLHNHIGNLLEANELSKIENELNKYISTHYYFKEMVMRLIQKTKAKYLVLEDANYGAGDKATILFAANQMNIVTIEVQHGTLDIAFQYGENILKDPLFKDHKTKYLLTFGKYWNHFIQSTTTGFDIGFPYIEDTYLKSNKPGSKEKLLFVSQGEYTNQLIPIAEELAAKLKGSSSEIIYRIHPLENENDEKYIPLKHLSNVSFSSGGDIYPLLIESKYIVGSYSTLLFEAALFNKSVLIHKNELSDEYIPKELGVWFNNINELYYLIDNSNETQQQSMNQLFWTIGWEKRMTEFYKVAGLN